MVAAAAREEDVFTGWDVTRVLVVAVAAVAVVSMGILGLVAVTVAVAVAVVVVMDGVVVDDVLFVVGPTGAATFLFFPFLALTIVHGVL